MRKGVWAIVLVGAGVALAWWLLARGGPGPTIYPVPGGRDGVTVEVLNASRQDGLARRITRALRRGSVDVVYFGTAPFDTLSSTVLAVRRGDTLRAARVRQILGVGRIVIDPDPGLLLDVSVYLGRDVAVPVEFRP